MKTKQIVFTAVNKTEVLDVEYEKPKAGEVSIALEYSAISNGTEKANLIGMRNSIEVAEGEPAEFPRTVGYSAAGVVEMVGDGVEDIKVGDRVVVAWGKHQKNITIQRDKVIKIPDGVTTKEASMLLISTFPLGAIRKTKLEIGESAMVMGLGILGIFAVQELKAAGAYPVIAVDPVKERRELALRLGADVAFDPQDDDFVKQVKEASDGGVSVCIEVTGLGVGLVQALDCMRKFGRIALLGCTRNSDFTIDYYTKVHGPGITIVGAHTKARPTESYPGYWTDEDDIKALLNLIKGGRLNFKDMISEVHKFEKAPEVFARLATEKDFPIGVLFDWR